MATPRVRVTDLGTGKVLDAEVLPARPGRKRRPSTVEGGRSSTVEGRPALTERQRNLRDLGLAIRRRRRGSRSLVEAMILGTLDVLARRAGW